MLWSAKSKTEKVARYTFLAGQNKQEETRDNIATGEIHQQTSSLGPHEMIH